MSSMGSTRIYRKSHIIFKVNDDALAIATIQPDAPVSLYFVIAHGEVKPVEVSEAEAGTWQAFELPDVTQKPDEPTIQLFPLQSYPEGETLTMYSFAISG